MLFQTALIEDADAIMHLVNAAYQVETGDTGCGFKRGNRFKYPFDSGMQSAYEEGRVLKVVEEKTQKLVGMARWRIDGPLLYFGPIAVHPDHQGRGIATMLLVELRKIADMHNLKGFSICVVNHRSDLIPWYQRQGFTITGEEPFTGEEIIRPSMMIHMEKLF